MSDEVIVEETSPAPKAERSKDFYSERRVRKGKTRKDHESGAWRQRQMNLVDRAGWLKEKGNTPCIKCHGLGNSSVGFKIKASPLSKG